MTGSKRAPTGAGMERTLARRGSAWHGISGVLALAAALALWVVVIAGVAAPLSDALARLDAQRPDAPATCAVPPDAVASAVPPPSTRPCR